MMSVLKLKQNFMCRPGRISLIIQQYCSNELDTSYSNSQKDKILQIINEETVSLSSYEITKARVKTVTEWIGKNGQLKSLSDIKHIEGFTEKHAKKLYNSLLDGPKKNTESLNKKIKGQVLQPVLSESIRRSCKTVLAVSVVVNSVCWTLIDRENYEVNEWKYYSLEQPNGKKMQLIDILNTAWDIAKQLPSADIYVMKAEATTLRASGSDPNNPKVLGVNLQKAQLVAMIVALINAKSNGHDLNGDIVEEEDQLGFSQKVYFLRSTLPYRLYGTLVGNEHVSTDQTVENIFQEAKERKSKSQVQVPEEFISMFRNQKYLQKDMLGQCLLLALTFMDVCVYLNKESINKLLKRGE